MTSEPERIKVDQNRCVGAGTCMIVAPTAFGWDERARWKSRLLDPSTVEHERLLEAALACPTQAIRFAKDGMPGNPDPRRGRRVGT